MLVRKKVYSFIMLYPFCIQCIHRSRMSPFSAASPFSETFKEQTTLIYTSGHTADNSG